MILRFKALCLALIISANIGNVQEQMVNQPELIRVTCYTWTGNRTASGIYPEEGQCASNWANMGKTAILYDADMNLIGEFVVTDTGGAKSLRNGTSIDIYRDTLARCYEWVGEYGDYLYIEWKE